MRQFSAFSRPYSRLRTTPRSVVMYAQSPASVIDEAPVSWPFGLNVADRLRRLLVGLPSDSVLMSTTTSPSAASLMNAYP